MRWKVHTCNRNKERYVEDGGGQDVDESNGESGGENKAKRDDEEDKRSGW
jgi:hypothetical protein